MADALITLAASASEPAGAIKDSINRTFAEFKRTHHDTWAATREAFGARASRVGGGSTSPMSRGWSVRPLGGLNKGHLN